MSFAFGFSGDDIEQEVEADDPGDKVQPTPIADTKQDSIAPRLHSLEELLESLPSQVSYNYLPIPSRLVARQSTDDEDASGCTLSVPRRSLFDIRQQLMAEADPAVNANDSLLSGLEQGDLTSGIYEGGFKTWECALDLASLVQSIELVNGNDRLHVIELGAGSAVPSLTLLDKMLRLREDCKDKVIRWPEVRFTLCDYNEDVLRLGTAANVFLTTMLCRRCDQRDEVEQGKASSEDEDLDFENIDESMIKKCANTLAKAGISIDFISGGWGQDFLDLIRSMNWQGKTLVLASETIYSPKSTEIFSKLLMDLLERKKSKSNAWVAAKKVYFGVGGGVQDFSDHMSRLGGSVNTIMDAKDSGVGRVVLEVTAS